MLWQHLSAVLWEKRDEAELTLRDLETPTGRDRSNLSRIETGETGRNIENLDAVVAGYAKATGTTSIALYREALERWEEEER